MFYLHTQILLHMETTARFDPRNLWLENGKLQNLCTIYAHTAASLPALKAICCRVSSTTYRRSIVHGFFGSERDNRGKPMQTLEEHSNSTQKGNTLAGCNQDYCVPLLPHCHCVTAVPDLDRGHKIETRHKKEHLIFNPKNLMKSICFVFLRLLQNPSKTLEV